MFTPFVRFVIKHIRLVCVVTLFAFAVCCFDCFFAILIIPVEWFVDCLVVVVLGLFVDCVYCDVDLLCVDCFIACLRLIVGVGI